MKNVQHFGSSNLPLDVIIAKWSTKLTILYEVDTNYRFGDFEHKHELEEFPVLIVSRPFKFYLREYEKKDDDKNKGDNDETSEPKPKTTNKTWDVQYYLGLRPLSHQRKHTSKPRGFYLDHKQRSLGYVYDISNLFGVSSLKGSPQPECKTPEFLMQSRKDPPPAVKDRIELSRSLAERLSGLHDMRHMHGGLMPSKVLFCTPTGKYSDKWFRLPFFIGYTGYLVKRYPNATAKDMLEEEYWHCLDDNSFGHETQLMRSDYYSLGIMLLEIGLWRPAEDIGVSKASLLSELPDQLTKDLIEELGDYGENYAKFVGKCLELSHNLSYSEKALTSSFIAGIADLKEKMKWNVRIVLGNSSGYYDTI